MPCMRLLVIGAIDPHHSPQRASCQPTYVKVHDDVAYAPFIDNIPFFTTRGLK